MRDEKEERKKQARSNKQTRQSNTAHPCTCMTLHRVATCILGTCVHVYVRTCVALLAVLIFESKVRVYMYTVHVHNYIYVCTMYMYIQ